MFYLLLILSFNVFAFDPHEGGGGNACKHPKYDKMILVDEVGWRWQDGLLPVFSTLHRSKDLSTGLSTTDLTRTDAYHEAKRVMRKASHTLNAPGAALYRFFISLDRVYLAFTFSDRDYGLDHILGDFCQRNSTRLAFFSSNRGYSVISQSVWSQLDGESRRNLLIHESVRLLQIYSRLPSLTNEEISIWTKLLSLGKFSILSEREAFKEMVRHFQIQDQNQEGIWVTGVKRLKEAVLMNNLPSATFWHFRLLQVDMLRSGSVPAMRMFRDSDYLRLLELRFGPDLLRSPED